MLWNSTLSYEHEPFETESDLEEAICNAAGAVFGQTRVYLDVKKRIGGKGKVQNVPDGYLLDLASARLPRLGLLPVSKTPS